MRLFHNHRCVCSPATWWCRLAIGEAETRPAPHTRLSTQQTRFSVNQHFVFLYISCSRNIFCPHLGSWWQTTPEDRSVDPLLDFMKVASVSCMKLFKRLVFNRIKLYRKCTHSRTWRTPTLMYFVGFILHDRATWRSYCFWNFIQENQKILESSTLTQ